MVTTTWSPMWNSLDLSCLLCTACKSVFTDCRDISTPCYIDHLDMVTTTTTKSWSLMWNSLDLSCLLCAVCKSVLLMQRYINHLDMVTTTMTNWKQGFKWSVYIKCSSHIPLCILRSCWRVGKQFQVNGSIVWQNKRAKFILDTCGESQTAKMKTRSNALAKIYKKTHAKKGKSNLLDAWTRQPKTDKIPLDVSR